MLLQYCAILFLSISCGKQEGSQTNAVIAIKHGRRVEELESLQHPANDQKTSTQIMHYLIDNLWKAISQIMSNGKESLEKKTTEKTNNASVIIYVINNYIEEEVGDDEEKKPMIKQSATMINTELRDGNKTTSLAKKHGNNKQQKSTTKLADKILKTSELTTQSLKLSPSKNHTNIFSSKSTKKAKEKSGRVRVKKPEIDTTSSIILPKMNLDTKIVLSSVTTVSDTQSRMTAYPFQNISSNYSIGDKATTKSLKKITNNSISQKLTTKIENRPTEAIQMSTDFAKIDEHNFDAPNAFGNQSSTSIVTSTEAMKIETKLTTMKYQNLSVPMKEEDSKRKQTKQNQQMQNKKVISLTTRTVKKIATNKKKSKVSSQVLFGMSAHLPKNNSVKFISKIIKTISIPLSIAASSTETKNVSKTSRRNFMDANAFSKISLKNNTTKALLKLSTLEPKTTKRSLSIKTSSESNNFQAKKKNSLKTMVTSNTIAPAKTTGVMKSKEVILKSNVSRANFSSSVTETLTSPKFEINSQAFSLPTLSQLLPVTMATSQTLNNNSQLSTNNPSMLNVIADDEVEIENTSSLTSANNSSDHLLEKSTSTVQQLLSSQQFYSSESFLRSTALPLLENISRIHGSQLSSPSIITNFEFLNNLISLKSQALEIYLLALLAIIEGIPSNEIYTSSDRTMIFTSTQTSAYELRATLQPDSPANNTSQLTFSSESSLTSSAASSTKPNFLSSTISSTVTPKAPFTSTVTPKAPFTSTVTPKASPTSIVTSKVTSKAPFTSTVMPKASLTSIVRSKAPLTSIVTSKALFTSTVTPKAAFTSTVTPKASLISTVTPKASFTSTVTPKAPFTSTITSTLNPAIFPSLASMFLTHLSTAMIPASGTTTYPQLRVELPPSAIPLAIQPAMQSSLSYLWTTVKPTTITARTLTATTTAPSLESTSLPPTATIPSTKPLIMQPIALPSPTHSSTIAPELEPSKTVLPDTLLATTTTLIEKPTSLSATTLLPLNSSFLSTIAPSATLSSSLLLDNKLIIEPFSETSSSTVPFLSEPQSISSTSSSYIDISLTDFTRNSLQGAKNAYTVPAHDSHLLEAVLASLLSSVYSYAAFLNLISTIPDNSTAKYMNESESTIDMINVDQQKSITNMTFSENMSSTASSPLSNSFLSKSTSYDMNSVFSSPQPIKNLSDSIPIQSESTLIIQKDKSFVSSTSETTARPAFILRHCIGIEQLIDSINASKPSFIKTALTKGSLSWSRSAQFSLATLSMRIESQLFKAARSSNWKFHVICEMIHEHFQGQEDNYNEVMNFMIGNWGTISQFCACVEH